MSIAIERRSIMWEDAIVEEVHAVREQLLARFDGDLHRYCEYVRSLPAPASVGTKMASPSVVPADIKPGQKPEA
jgi:hypothetical protein